MTFLVARIAAAAAALIASSGTALAHTGAGANSGFAHGLVHPIGGLDHVLAMVAVGLYAALLGGRALWLVPATSSARAPPWRLRVSPSCCARSEDGSDTGRNSIAPLLLLRIIRK